MICSMDVLDPTGHVTLEWDPDDEASVAKAESEFDRLRDAGFAFFTEVETFDPKAGKLDADFADAPAPAAKKKPAPKRTRSFPKRAKRTVAVAPMRGG